MKKHIGLLLLILAVSAQAGEVRITQLFNFGWKFHYGDINDAQVPAFDDTAWRGLDLPHDFQFEQPWDEKSSPARGFKPMGVGWYRKTFKADEAWKGRRVLLDVEGIMLIGDVWLNGTKVGSTDYGYLGFETDISKYLNYDGDNVLAVRASTGETGGSRWYTGGGLYRDVHIVVKNQVAIARHGVFVTTPLITDAMAEVSVQVDIEGFRGKADDLEIKAEIFGPDGRKVAEVKDLAPKRANRWIEEVKLPLTKVDHPQLWSCETPNLYTAVVTLTLEGKPVDRFTEKFGIRTIEFSKEFGFKLNGKKVFLKGISNHHDMGPVGAAAYDAAAARQMDVLKKFGYNHIRTSHNPYSKAFLRLADEKGFIVVDELYDKWSNRSYWGGRKPWTGLWFEHLTEWIKRDRNHPSVVLWSLGNELQMREDLAGYPTGDWGVTTYRIMDVVAKRLDPTRKTTVAMFPARAGGIGKNHPDFNTKIIPPELATVTDVSSFNYRWMNYPNYLEHAPDMIIYQSEATTNELVAPFYGMDRERMVGLAYWGAIEYWGESHGWPRKGWNYSFFNHALEPFPQAYLIKSIFSDEPLVHIGVVDSKTDTLTWNDIVVGLQPVSSHWNRTAGKKYSLFTYTNAEEVELLVNGKSVGVKKNDATDVDKRNMVLWQNVSYAPGRITAIARTKGKEVARHQLETTGKAVALRMEVENAGWKADGMDLQYVKVYAVDSKGRVVPEAAGEVVFDVAGAGRIIAVANGDHSSNDLFDGNKRQLHKGFAMVVIRSHQQPGEVKVKASVKGLRPAEKKMITQ
ncbi:MAG: beta-galactosidase [Paludibacter sp. 47-17]|nr:MAG: beta-galactosidase [Paludibacter sp. SCN 50-10]OJX88028.1 MAG: beta-galactosidase [Paludibacter sp. 47-17]